MAPNFKVLRWVPTYNDRDGIDCYRGRVVETAYTEAWAFHLLDRYTDDGMDETRMEVRDASGLRVFRTFPQADEVMPF